MRKGFHAPRVSDEHRPQCKPGTRILTLFSPCLGHLIKWNELTLILFFYGLCVPTLGRGKLMDDLDSSQFDLLVKLPSLPSSARDFRHLDASKS